MAFSSGRVYLPFTGFGRARYGRDPRCLPCVSSLVYRRHASHESLFLSVTARTAGFNTVDTGHLTDMSLVMLIVLMVIGFRDSFDVAVLFTLTLRDPQRESCPG